MMDGMMKSQSSTMMMMMMIFCEALSLDQAADRVSVHLALYSAVFFQVVVAVMQTAVDEGTDLLLLIYFIYSIIF